MQGLCESEWFFRLSVVFPKQTAAGKVKLTQIRFHFRVLYVAYSLCWLLCILRQSIILGSSYFLSWLIVRHVLKTNEIFAWYLNRTTRVIHFVFLFCPVHVSSKHTFWFHPVYPRTTHGPIVREFRCLADEWGSVTMLNDITTCLSIDCYVDSINMTFMQRILMISRRKIVLMRKKKEYERVGLKISSYQCFCCPCLVDFSV